jgi:hypothetical protein
MQISADTVKQVLDWLSKQLAAFMAKPEQPVQLKVDAPAPAPTPKLDVVSVYTGPLAPGWHEVDWKDPNSKVSLHFTVKEALWLPQWNRMANESDGLNDTVKANLINIFRKMDDVRDFLGKPIRVHCAYRSKEYNALVKGAPQSSHMADQESAAVDWDCGENCYETQKKLEPKLEGWGLRMENNGPEANWVHLDDHVVPPGGHRWFNVK